jgi:secreted trypsin-like serine protease
MPKSITMDPRCVLALVAALAVAAMCCAPAGAVVGGTRATDADPPTGPLYYQVALIRKDRPTTSAGQFCGGSIRRDTDGEIASRHIVTAAHCVFDNSATAPGQPISPANLAVFYADDATQKLSGPGKLMPVSAVSIDPSYNPATLAHDAAVLTLADPDPLDGTTAQPIDFVTASQWQPPAPSIKAVVSGWGRIDPSTYPDDLMWAEMPLATDDVCGQSWAAEGADTSIMACAGQPGVDSCFGDSGGPLAVQINPGLGAPRFPALVGIVSYGDLACDGSPPGVYTRVASSAIQSYISEADPISAPRNTSPPVVGGVIEAGQTITCEPGSWDGDPTLEYQFVRGLDQRTTAALTNLGAQRSYVVSSADVGSQLSCVVKGHNGGGLAFRQSAWTATVPTPTSPPPPPPAQPPNQSPSQNLQDIVAPVARITGTRCTATRCTLTVAVTDAGFSAGIKTVQASVRSSYRSQCKRKGHRKTVACIKHRTIRPSVAALTATHFKVVASKLPYGTQVFTLLAVDKAGHRQALPTTKTVKTKKPRKRR